MKKLLVVLTVLAMATVANAALKISVNGVVDRPDNDPVLVLSPSDHVVIDIYGDGETAPPWPDSGGGWLIVEGPGTISGGTLLYTGGLSDYTTIPPAELPDIKAWLESIGYNNVGGAGTMIFAHGSVPMPPLGPGKLVDSIDFHCEAIGQVLITLAQIYDPGTGAPPTITVMDTQILQIPEPMTLALLGLGGLFLRRRK